MVLESMKTQTEVIMMIPETTEMPMVDSCTF